jgi:hypothetical protein
MIIPAQDPKTGMPAPIPLAQRLDQIKDRGQLPDRGRLAAGDDQAVDSRELGRGGAPEPARAPAAVIARTCSATSPCSASTPTAAVR